MTTQGAFGAGPRGAIRRLRSSQWASSWPMAARRSPDQIAGGSAVNIARSCMSKAGTLSETINQTVSGSMPR